MTPPAIDAPWPDRIIAWQHMPVALRRYITKRLVERMLLIHEGPADLIRFLYAGVPDARYTAVESYRMSPEDFYPFLVADARAWMAERASAKAAP